MVEEESGALHITFGSSYKTSDFIVDTLEAKWEAMAEQEQAETNLIQITMDNGPESSGRRTPFLSRMVQLADRIHKPIQLLYYPPSHSKYGISQIPVDSSQETSGGSRMLIRISNRDDASTSTTNQ